MSSCMEELSTLVRMEASSTALKFLDLMIGGFEAEELELIVPSPGPKTHVFVFVRDGGSWTEVKSCVQEDGGTAAAQAAGRAAAPYRDSVLSHK
jgi:hypothetical protein